MARYSRCSSYYFGACNYFRCRIPRLTLLGRSLLLIVAELFINAICWITAAILFGRGSQYQSLIGLAVLAWTIGLRHALDADHISAIDNATRSLLSKGQLPVTCGLYFSLGHSTIVIIVNVTIAISSNIYDKLEGFGNVGGIIGTAVSGSFLLLVGLANTVILWQILRKRRLQRRNVDGESAAQDCDEADDVSGGHHNSMLMMRILGPLINYVDRPWKMYPVGVLFGLGFDTASSIALLAVSAIAKKGSEGQPIPPSDIVILPLLFTAAMTLVDSLDSILMLYSYSGFPERSWAVIDRSSGQQTNENMAGDTRPPVPDDEKSQGSIRETIRVEEPPEHTILAVNEQNPRPIPTSTSQIIQTNDDRANFGTVEKLTSVIRTKNNAMSGLSIILTLMSILLAFSIAIIEIMGLIGQYCRRCRDAASGGGGHGGGLAGQWWRAWEKANANSGLIGAAVVGVFVTIVALWYLVSWFIRRSVIKFWPVGLHT